MVAASEFLCSSALDRKIVHIDVAVFITFYNHHFHAGHHRAGWVGAVG